MLFDCFKYCHRIIFLFLYPKNHDTEHFSMIFQYNDEKKSMTTTQQKNMNTVLYFEECVISSEKIFNRCVYFWFLINFLSPKRKGELKLSCLQQEKRLQEGNICRERKNYTQRILVGNIFFPSSSFLYSNTFTRDIFSLAKRKARTTFLHSSKFFILRTEIMLRMRALPVSTDFHGKIHRCVLVFCVYTLC